MADATVKRRIREASDRARREMVTLDADSLARLDALYRDVLALIESDLRRAAGRSGEIALEQLERLRERIGDELLTLAREQRVLLDTTLRQAATVGAAPFAAAAADLSVDRLAAETVRFIRSFEAADGLTLSDRLWKLDGHTERQILDTLTRQVIVGNDATRAAQALLRDGIGVSQDLIDRMGLHRLDALRDSLQNALMHGEMNPYDQARRVMRTEINRAHGEAYRAGMEATPGVIGERFNLSSNHRVPDECDYHARANLYGLGPGVYPVGQSPWPAHPNTLSFLTIVFDDEITATDRDSRSDGHEILDALSDEELAGVMGGKEKARAYREGKLTPQDLTKPLREVEGRL